MNYQYWDISVPLRHQMVAWPGDPLPHVEQVMFLDRGDICNLTRLAISAHTATHMDAPRHFIARGASIESMPLDATLGPARVIEIQDPQAIRRAELERHAIQPGERLLFKTRNSQRDWANLPFDEDFVYLADEGAQYLVERGVRTIGVDYLSIGGFRHDTVETHVTILGAGIWVIEGLQLAAVEPGLYELLCLPIPVAGADGSPARAVLRRPRASA